MTAITADLDRDADVTVHERLFIGGVWQTPSTDAKIQVHSPATETLIGTVPEGREADIDHAVAAARRAFDDGPWPRLSARERAGYLRAIAAELDRRGEETARVLTAEVGSLYSVNRYGRVPVQVGILQFFASLGDELELAEERTGLVTPSTILREPVGVVAAIVPWNGPLYLSLQKLAPALVAGCTVVLKPAPETPLSEYILADAIEAAGVPEGVVSIVAAGREVGQYLVEHPGVDKIAFTGSTAAGRAIMAACAGQVKRVSLELGGKSAAIVLDDADLEVTIPALVLGGTTNNGQTCCATTRIIVSEARHDEVVDALCAAFEGLEVGDPFAPSTAIGPLIAERQRQRVEGYISLARDEGATVATGGGRPAGLERGWYVQPTVLTNVRNEMRVAREEIFGPVVSVITHRDPDDAVRLANDSDYGLACSVYGVDTDRAAAVARRVRAGTCNVNCFSFDFANPFGGFKQSGIGREGGPEALSGFLEYKTLTVASGTVAG
jgi:aldehyde dehydrogenase (NAD+)